MQIYTQRARKYKKGKKNLSIYKYTYIYQCLEAKIRKYMRLVIRLTKIEAIKKIRKCRILIRIRKIEERR